MFDHVTYVTTMNIYMSVSFCIMYFCTIKSTAWKIKFLKLIQNRDGLFGYPVLRQYSTSSSSSVV